MKKLPNPAERISLYLRLPATFLLTASILAGTACMNAAQPEEADLNIEMVNAFPNLNFSDPLYVMAPSDGTDRLFVLEQDGRVFVFDNDPGVTPNDLHLALDISPKVYRGHNEEGLLGMAFHPNLQETRQIFLYYSANNPRRVVISRFEMDESLETIDPDTETTILEIEQPRGNHNGGGIEFGPDGYLYLGVGDGGGGGDPFRNSQNLGTILGAMLRIDVDARENGLNYGIPEDNPFVDNADARDEIWAYGLRNPWRFSFDPETGQLWMGDVCQSAWEKIHLGQAGGNYGWPFLEGSNDYDGIPDDVDPETLIAPIAEHPHPVTQSITGGYVYRGAKAPELEGAYVYGDFVTGIILKLRYDEETGEATEPRQIGRIPQITSFGLDQDRELLVVSRRGEIFRVESAE